MNTDGLAAELVDVAPANGHLSRGITIRFDPETLKELRRRARLKGIGPTTLARIWIIERLQDEEHSAAASLRDAGVGSRRSDR